jgi:hypothetical protein
LKVSLNSQIIYSGYSALFSAGIGMGPLQRTGDVIDPVLVWRDGPAVRGLSLQRNKVGQD